MKAHKIVFVAAVALSLQGCWFVFIPGSVVGAVTDSITGAEGQNCVSAGARVGDRVRTPGGGSATIKSLSGTSTRCSNPELPIRALLVYDGDRQAQGQRNCELKTEANGEQSFVCPPQ